MSDYRTEHVFESGIKAAFIRSGDRWRWYMGPFQSKVYFSFKDAFNATEKFFGGLNKNHNKPKRLGI